MQLILKTFIACSSILLTACTPQRTGFDVKQFQEVASSTQFDQIKMQLARSIDNPYSLPTITSIGTTQIRSSSSFSLEPTRVTANSGGTDTGALKIGPFTANADATVNTTSSPFAILAMRDLYTYAVKGEKNYSPEVEAALYSKPPSYGWLYWSTSGIPSDCPKATCSPLGRYGKYNLWTKSQKDYSDFALSVFEASTLQLTSIQVKRPVSVTVPRKGKKTTSQTKFEMTPVIQRKPQASPDVNIITE